MMRLVVPLVLAALAFTLVLGGSQASGSTSSSGKPECQENATLCAEVAHSIGYGGAYTGHDEPSLLFYSNTPGSGNSMTYSLSLPEDPPTLPTQDGTGGTFDFQLHPTFWFSMATCDDQSDPNPGGSYIGPNVACTPDSDANIYDSPDPTSPRYIGRHPGGAFMELQFYPPGWVPFQTSFQSCEATHWCAALTIDSFSFNENTGQPLNDTCQKIVGIEPINFAFITTSGVPHATPNPVNSTPATFTPNSSTDLFMNPGDRLTLSLRDTRSGIAVVIRDLTTHQTGSMTASAKNGFGAVQFAPAGKSCTSIPYDFHPMYSTSSEMTRVPFLAHSSNIAFSDEIGHFEYCNKVAVGSLKCTQEGANDTSGTDSDDNFCFPASSSTRVAVSGCVDSDFDFDGVSYETAWPGTFTNPSQDALVHPTPIRFTSPLTNGQNYQRIAFETDLPRIEFATTPPCQRHLSNPADPSPGSGCVNPPPGAFYPIYSTTGSGASCRWQFGGPNIPGTTNTFGGTSTAEYGPLFPLFYPASNGQPQYLYEDFRNILANPCPTS
jgi:hypothetical protein